MQYETIKQIAARCNVTVVTIYRWRKTEKFPAPFKLGPNTTRYSIDEVEAWLKSRRAEV
ncbi:helix-turn-helix transcriptional regulator [Aliiruegeria lutimaris]|uniref:Transcriptional regulator, AlpA family n=1 Tax=Aliiruegeria lutimaris TaxID=571298 RepID=A0A1G8UX18_9RHOB|nr:transcriptional regulator, AlpA family [Aliiruegeria lutimaris]